MNVSTPIKVKLLEIAGRMSEDRKRIPRHEIAIDQTNFFQIRKKIVAIRTRWWIAETDKFILIYIFIAKQVKKLKNTLKQ